ncbi:mechanosensitive ion channel family protein [Pleurocapsales cyanobacterium LEGE 06147]|nr:mechanosensitive ion channel family protein [Pleurocapsales cyanobacterium LEGE 06147]
MNQLLETVFQSIQELIGNGVKILPALLIALIIILLTRYAAEFVQRICDRISRHTLKSRSLQLLFCKSSYVLTWVVGVLIASVVAFPGLRLGDIVATLGLGSVAIGFAFQDIFKNFLAGILLLIQEPFCINDQIVVDDYEGTVEQIDIRTTTIRTYNGERVLLPNSTVFTSAVLVRTAFSSRRTDLEVGVDYNTSLPKAAKILEQVTTKVEGVLEEPAPEIDLVEFGDSSINFAVRYWTLPQKREVRHTRTRVIMAIKQAFDEADISIPYPIRSIYFYNQDKYNDYLPASNNAADNKLTRHR